jgi:hypothetical protein
MNARHPYTSACSPYTRSNVYKSPLTNARTRRASASTSRVSLSLSLSLSRLFLFLLRRLCATLSFVAGRSKDERVSCPLLFLPRREIFRGDFRGFLMGGSFEIFCASQERQEAESDEAGTKASKGEEWPWLREE